MKKVEVVAAVIKENGRYFATQRGYGDFKGGWEFPGGKIEFGEIPEEAIHREIKEELNIEIEIDDFICTVEYQYPKFFLVMHCYLCHIKSGEIELLEHKDAKWLEIDSIDSVEWLEADIEVVEKIKELHS